MSDNKKNDNNIKTGKKKDTWKYIRNVALSLGALAITILQARNNNNNNQNS